MKIFLVSKGSTGLDGLKRAERERPTPQAGQVLVRMRAASLNFRDLAIVAGKYFRGPVERDTIPLSDGAGEVEGVGPGVTQFKAGERVVATFTQGHPPAALGLPLDGTLAEYCVFGVDGLLKVPPHLSYEEAATLPCAGVTVWNALMHGPRVLKAGETVLSLGTGGVAIFALQIAKMAGARSIITSSSDAKLERARALGADDVINYKTTPDWDKKVLELTDGQGAEHVIDTGGVGTLPKSYVAVGPGGVVSIIGVMTRPEGDLSPYPLMFKGAMARGIFVGGREHFEALMKAVAVNEFKPVVDKTFDFDAAPEAFKYLKSAQHFGKVVIKI
ncbi:MAG TPA: NAD(P)-dependent alcohol dehydrogenase [Gammaproteobacteria bacterium]|nr:NAD(P)-dependent alcohol dehydrogenase [Gammaproteobacteria bacterium]